MKNGRDIDLITATIAPDSWSEVGGSGSVRQYETTLSLVIRQTQKVHEEISDLLDQLRRLQDLQVTIEVRFIRLTDEFFERIGVDFDFNIEDNSYLAQVNGNTSAQALTKAEIIVALETAGVEREAAQEAWSRIQRRISKHDGVVVEKQGRDYWYRWDADLASAPDPADAFERIVSGELGPFDRQQLVEVIRGALAAPSASGAGAGPVSVAPARANGRVSDRVAVV